MYAVLILVISVFSSTFNSKTEDPLIFCQCISDLKSDQAPDQKIKDVYTFLVRGKTGWDCCEENALTAYKGYYEKWVDDDYGKKKTMSSTDAQATICNTEGKSIMAVKEEDFSIYVAGYYPNLSKEIDD